MDGWVTIGTELDTKRFDRQIEDAERKLNELEGTLENAELLGLSSRDIQELNVELEKTKNKLISLKQQKDKLESKSGGSIADIVSSVNKSTESIIKKVGRWALAVFSVRSAYNIVRQASSTLAQYNEQYAKNLEYIRFAIAQALAPILEYIVNLALKLLSYINYIAQAWFGINLFSKASANNMNKMSKNAKEIRKELAGFDEMNILGANTSVAGNAGAIAPSIDLSKINADVPKWLQWIADHKEEVLTFFGVLGGLIAGIKIGNLLKNFGLLGEKLNFLKGIGIGVVIFGAINLIRDLSKYIKLLDGDLLNNGTSWNDFGKIVKDVGLIILGIGLITGNLPVVIAGALITIVGLFTKNWEKIEKGFDDAKTYIESKMDSIREKWGAVGVAMATGFIQIIDNMKIYWGGFVTSTKQVFDGILLMLKGEFKNGATQIFKGIVNALITVYNMMIGMVNTHLVGFQTLINEIGRIFGQNWNLNAKLPIIRYLATGGIVNMPGRGVPVGGAYAGERGAEGVIPLTDTQAMETLGATIGKYININATIINKMNSRVISREMQNIKNQQDFAYNS